MFPHRPSTRARLAHTAERLRARIHPERAPAELQIAAAPGRISHAGAQSFDYRPAMLGHRARCGRSAATDPPRR